ncbi:MAG: hypothetical protein H6Q89_5161 [Myxococcaceae bacterium]|nr:hypothetical protein [Myxococcaceae bacterium]
MVPSRTRYAAEPMAPRKKSKAVDERATHVRHLLAVDAANVIERLVTRQQEMVALFSRRRDRTPMLEAVRSWFLSITFAELSLLPPAEQKAVSLFYELLDELRWYLQYTEDMPTQVLQKVALYVGRLETCHRQLVAAIGPSSADGVAVVEARVVRRSAG